MDIRRNKKRWKVFAAALAAALAAGVMFGPAAVYGAEAGAHADLMRKGSVSVAMVDKTTNRAVGGGEMTLYHVAEIVREDWNDAFIYTEEFSGCGLALDDLESASLAAGLTGYAWEAGIPGNVKEIDSDGIVSFEELEVGLYLLAQTKTADGYEAVTPFLVSVPILINGELNYDVNATPKTSGVVGEPTNPTDPSDPTSPAEPTDPTSPAEPTDPTSPTDPTRPDSSDDDDDDDDDDTRRPTRPQAEPTEAAVITDHYDDETPEPTLPESTDTEPAPDDSTEPMIVATGQLWWPVPVLCGAGALFLLFGWLEKRRS